MLLKSLNEFLMNATEAKSFVVSQWDVEAMAASDTIAFNGLVQKVRAGGNFNVEQVDGGFRFTKMVYLYAGGKEDARVGTVAPNNPFRPRYRKLSDGELSHHDAIKTQAMALLDLFNDTVKVRSVAQQHSDGEVLASLKLAQRHLEDAVYRAVKALTA